MIRGRQKRSLAKLMLLGSVLAFVVAGIRATSTGAMPGGQGGADTGSLKAYLPLVMDSSSGSAFETDDPGGPDGDDGESPADGGQFEIDGNAVADEAGNMDWANAAYPPALLIADAHSRIETDPTTFRPDGKFARPGHWSIKPGMVGPGQNELTNVMSWLIFQGDLGQDSPPETQVVMAMERTKKEGTFFLDFEYNQIAWDGSSGGPQRAPGDLVVGFELKGNPIDPQADLRVLIIQYLPAGPPSSCKTTLGNGNKILQVEVGSEACPPYGAEGWYYRFLANGEILASSGLGEATMNAGPVEAPWESFDAQGNPRATIGPFQFAEASLNLRALAIEPGCTSFSSLHAKDRSSLEVNADLKDLAGPARLAAQCSIEGHKFLDVDGDGVWNQSVEPPLPGWEITLDNGATTVTDENGGYEFEILAEGTYTVAEVCPKGWAQTAPGATGLAGCGDETYTVEVSTQNRRVADLDFGNGQPEIAVEKNCQADVFVGDAIDYEIMVTNTGNVALQDVILEDPQLGVSEALAGLEPGESQSVTASLQAAEAGLLENVATASASYAGATSPVSASDTCATNVYALDVTKTTEPSFARRFNWSIVKAVDDPGPVPILLGRTFDATYQITVDADGEDSDWAVRGSITVENPAPMAANLSAVLDEVSGGIPADVICPSLTVPAGATLTCQYGPVPLPDGSARTNTAIARLQNNDGGTTDFVGTADAIFDGVTPTSLVDEQILVTDDNGTPDDPADDRTLGTVSVADAPLTFTYTRTFGPFSDESLCHEALPTVKNRAKGITNDTVTEISDTADVTIYILCTMSLGYEDLPLSAGNDWDYNDLVLDMTVNDTRLPNGNVSEISLLVTQRAGPASEPPTTAFVHEFHMAPDGLPGCAGNYRLTTVDATGATTTRTGPFTNGQDFLIIPDTKNPPESVELLIQFTAPGTGCPFNIVDSRPLRTFHGRNLFANPWIVARDPRGKVRTHTIRRGDVRLLSVPSTWQWPAEKQPIWEMYKCAGPTTDPAIGPIFVPFWWTQTEPPCPPSPG